MNVNILGINRTATCNGDGTMTVHSARIGGTDYLSYERECDCPDCQTQGRAEYQARPSKDEGLQAVKAALEEALAL